MGEPYLAEIFLGGWNFAPKGFATCDGQVLSISQNTALFSLLGTNFGGNGTSTFQLPDLRGRLPIHQGQGPGLSAYNVGQQAGVETVILTSSQIPAHNHSLQGSLVPNTNIPTNAYLAASPVTGSGPNATSLNTYSTTAPNGSAILGASSIGLTGGGQAHTNIQPVLGVTYVIALQGIFPARN